MMTCKEVVQAVTAETPHSRSLAGRIAIRMHLLLCRHCNRYAQQLRILAKGAREAGKKQESLEGLKQKILESRDLLEP